MAAAPAEPTHKPPTPELDPQKFQGSGAFELCIQVIKASGVLLVLRMCLKPFATASHRFWFFHQVPTHECLWRHRVGSGCTFSLTWLIFDVIRYAFRCHRRT